MGNFRDNIARLIAETKPDGGPSLGDFVAFGSMRTYRLSYKSRNFTVPADEIINLFCEYVDRIGIQNTAEHFKRQLVGGN